MVNFKKNNQVDNGILLILLSLILLYFYKLGFPSIWNPNEAFYAETPREMLEKKEFLTPYFNYEYRFQKPVLMYWLVLPWYTLLGIKETAVRIVSAVAAVWGVLVTYWLAKTIWNDKRSGLISAAILASAFDFNSAARYASPEMLVTTLITSGLVLFYRGYLDDTKYKSLWYFSVYIMCALATLTKGPIGIIVPFLIISVFFLIKKDFQGLKQFISVKGFLVYFLISFPWCFFMIYKYGDQFLSVVVGETISRFLGKTGRPSSPFFYFTVLPWNFLPGSVFIIPALIWFMKIVKKEHHILFPFIWFLVVFIFFSLSKSKLPTYIYPLFPALSIIIGGWIKTSLEGNPKEGTILLWLSPIVPLFIVAALFWIRSYLPEVSLLVISLLIILFFFCLWNIKKRTYYLSLIACLVSMSLFYFVFLLDVIPQVERYRPYREMAQKVNLIDPENKSIFYCYNAYQQNLSFYLRRKILEIPKEDELLNLLKTEKDAIFLLKQKTYQENYIHFGREVIWSGLFYNKSESRFMRFLTDIKNGKIEKYVLIK